MTVWRVINRLRGHRRARGMTALRDRRLTTHHVRQTLPARFVLVPVPHRVAPRPPRRHGGAVAQPPAAARRASWPPGGSSPTSSTRATGHCGGPCGRFGRLDRHRRAAGLSLEVGRQAEVGELLGAEEVVVPDDPAIGHLDHLDGPGPAAAHLVVPEAGGAVHVDRQQLAVLVHDALAQEPAREVVGPDEPEVERRHRQDDVVAQQADQLGDVVALERIDVKRLVAGVDGGVELLAWSAARRSGPAGGRC